VLGREWRGAGEKVLGGIRAFSMNSSALNRQILLYIAGVLIAAWLWMLSIKLGFRPS